MVLWEKFSVPFHSQWNRLPTLTKLLLLQRISLLCLHFVFLPGRLLWFPRAAWDGRFLLLPQLYLPVTPMFCFHVPKPKLVNNASPMLCRTLGSIYPSIHPSFSVTAHCALWIMSELEPISGVSGRKINSDWTCILLEVDKINEQSGKVRDLTLPALTTTLTCICAKCCLTSPTVSPTTSACARRMAGGDGGRG